MNEPKFLKEIKNPKKTSAIKLPIYRLSGCYVSPSLLSAYAGPVYT